MRFRAAEQNGTATLAGWVGHAAVRGIIERHKDDAEGVVSPIARHLTDQKQVTRFCWYTYGIAGIGPDWQLRRDAPWMLDPVEQRLFGRVVTLFRTVVRMTVSELADAGVPVVSAWAGDHATVGEMLLLDVPWDLPAEELAEGLNSPGNGALDVNAGGTSVRIGIGEPAESNLGAIRRKYEQHLHGPRRRAPYAGGGKRKDRYTTTERREALAQVLEAFPDVTASKIVATFGSYTRLPGGRAGSPGGYLRQLLQKNAEPGDLPRCPARDTLHKDLVALRAEKGEKPSE